MEHDPLRRYFAQVGYWVKELEQEIEELKSKRSGDDQIPHDLKVTIDALKNIWNTETVQDIDAEAVHQLVEKASTSYEQLARQSVRQEQEERKEEYVSPGNHKLPPLPYEYDALEPYIDAEIMHLHHDKHHQSYVDGLNEAELAMQEARAEDDFDLLRYWEREAAFNGAGHYLHTIFWNNMSPNGGGEPGKKLAAFLRRDFGSVDAFRRHFTEAADKVQGPGWAILVWSPRARRLEILQAEMHHLLTQWDVIPLLVLDVWEHAYYLQYKNDRRKYIDQWWHVVNWPSVEKRFRRARQLMWPPY